MRRPIKLVFTNSRGESVELRSDRFARKHGPYLLQYPTGTGGAEAIIGTSGVAFGDGVNLNYSQLDKRLIKTDCMIYGGTDEERDLNLQKLAAVLDPRLGEGLITYTDHAGTYTIKGICKVSPSFQKSSLRGKWKPVLIDFLCPRPLWRGSSRTYFRVAYIEGGFRLPVRLPFRLGRQGFIATVHNPSGIPVPVELRIRGPADRPKLTNQTNGQSIQVNRQLSGRELLEIDTYEETVRITDTETNTTTDADGYIDLVASDWIVLEPGENVLRFNSQSDPLGTVVDGFFSDWLLGVG